MLPGPGRETPEQTALIEQLRRDRPYKMPKLFPRWEELSCIIGTISRTKTIKDAGGRPHHKEIWGHWATSQLPLYCVSKEMVRGFEATSMVGVQKIVCADDWRPALDGLLVVFPNDVYRPDGGAFIKAIAIKLEGFADDGRRRFCWSAVDSESVANGAIAVFQPQMEAELRLSGQTRNDLLSVMAMNCCLSISYAPELITLEPEPVAPHSLHRRRDRPIELQPRWIGKDYVRRPPSIAQGGHHRSPDPHWRGAHDRSQPCGPGSRDRKKIRIGPTFINGDPEE